MEKEKEERELGGQSSKELKELSNFPLTDERRQPK
jgi:hypothetical protein